MMFANFIYFIIVLLIYITYQPPEKTNFGPFETLFLFLCFIFIFVSFTRLQFHKLEKQISRNNFSFLVYKFDAIMARQSIAAILLFGINIYGLNLPSFFINLPVFSTIPTFLALIFLGIFIFYLSIIWVFAHKPYRLLYKTDDSRHSYVWSNITFSIPVLLPWLFLSGILDFINSLPFELPKQLLATTEGQVIYFLIFLFAIAIIGPAIIQKFWRCKPLEKGDDRSRIEFLCKKADLKYANILYWPAFGSRMITAGVMGLIKNFRYILVTGPLLNFLEPDEIDAVIAHEIGHIKRKHLIFYLIFFTGYMLLSYATYDLIIYLIIFSEPVLKLITSIGIEASLTGHLVFSTLHTNSAPESITRLLDMGMDPFNFSDAILGILAQRLVRTTCKKCKKPYRPVKEEYNELVREYGPKEFAKNVKIPFSEKLTMYKPDGCDACNNTGYSGRMAIHELLMGTDEMKKLIQSKAPMENIREQAIKDGMTTLKQDGIEKILAGNCDLLQVRRVCIK